MKRLSIFRGLPGSGKSTLANKVAALVVEPDMFRYDADRKYVFDSDKNAEVIRKTEDLLRYAMSHLEMPCLAVAATHVKLEHMKRYVELGREFGYAVRVVECRAQYGNIHEVPAATVARMAKDFEPFTPETAEEWGVEFEAVGQGWRPARVAEPARRWAVTYVDHGETCDGKARVHGVYGSRDEAVAELVKDMEQYAGKRPGSAIDYADWSVDCGDGAGCDWNVEGI